LREAESQLNALVAENPRSRRQRTSTASAVIPQTPSSLVMESVGRAKVEGPFMGEAPEVIVHRLDCSVLVVKPDGFKGPAQ
jgi:universal stress protein E